MSLKFHFKPMTISEDIGMLTMLHLPVFPMEQSQMAFETP